MSGYGKPTSKRNLRDKTLHKKGVDPESETKDNWRLTISVSKHNGPGC